MIKIMTHNIKNLSKSEIELTITVLPEEYEVALQNAAKKLAETAVIKGFRPGTAPYDIIKQQLGEQKIMETAIEEIVQKNYFLAIDQEKIKTVGMPMITMEKMAPGNEIIFKAKVALMPNVKLPDLSKINVNKKDIEITDKEIETVLTDLRKMRVKEVIKNDKATKDDKIIVDMEMFINKVPVEGGQAKGHQVYLNEQHYIPGFAEELIDLKKGDQKEFSLKFPKEHFQKHLAGKDVEIKVTAQDVYSLELPDLDENFAQSLGQKSLEELNKLLKENLHKEAEQKESERQEGAILEQLIEKSAFDEIPELLITAEKRKMFHELKHDLEHRGLDIAKYLADIKKTEEEIFNDFQAGAEKRVKASLIAHQVAEDNKIVAEQKDLEAEIEVIKHTYNHDKKIEENLKQPEIIDAIKRTIQNKKVVEWLKNQIISK